MIRNDPEYQETCHRIKDFQRQIREMAETLRQQGYSEEEVQVATAPTESLVEELKWERDFYNRLRQEGLAAIPDYPPEQRGKVLIAARIACGLSQRELADTLGVSEAQISRDEKNEYSGITHERYAKVLRALGVEEHIAGYQRSSKITIQMPTMTRKAATFRPDLDHRFSLTRQAEEP